MSYSTGKRVHMLRVSGNGALTVDSFHTLAELVERAARCAMVDDSSDAAKRDLRERLERALRHMDDLAPGETRERGGADWGHEDVGPRCQEKGTCECLDGCGSCEGCGRWLGDEPERINKR